MDMPLFKLKQILKSRYGKSIELRPVMDMAMLKTSSEALVHGNDLYIPIVVSEQFLGTAVVPHGWELCDENKKTIAELVRMVLEPKLYTEFLERRESNLRIVSSLEISAENLSLFGDDADSIVENSESANAEERPFNTSLIHLQGRQAQMVKKVAFQIHEFSARWAFVPFEDVGQEIKTVLDLCALGGMTLFVENVEQLSQGHQTILAEYVLAPRNLDEPLVITSSSLDLAELPSLVTNETLLNHFSQVHLEVERAPLNSTILRELLDLFFIRDGHQDLH
jgi:hypothetical protein